MSNNQQAFDPNGRFVWHELRTNQPKKSIAFFTEALGWKTNIMNVGGRDYTLLLAGETPVGGVVPAEKGPAGFISYAYVDDVDAAAVRVHQAGGKVIGEAYDIPTIGRMVEVEDQDGARFCLYKGLGEQKPDPQVPGVFHWNELWARDDKRAVSFLTSVIGYSVESMPMSGMAYNILVTKSGYAGGVMKSPLPTLAPSWLPYVHVDNTDQTVVRAKKLGATLEGEISDIENVGRYAVLHAPDGARFAVITPAAKK